MTQIIVGRLPGGASSLGSFYMARARRIVPALAVLCAVVLLYGAIFVDPLQYERMAKDGLSALLFVSNIWFATQQGYFAPAAEANWFLHSWSLSIEWQFYLAYPLLLMALARSPLRHRIGTVLGVAALASFVAAEFIALFRPDLLQWSFFLLPTRAWEMLAGGLVVVWGEKIAWTPIARRVAAWAGLVAIAVSAIAFDRLTVWPSHWSLLPVAGTALVIAAREPRPFWASIPGVQAIGRWSYSIYLWHWPLVCVLGYYGLQSSRPAVVAAGLASIALGALSFRLVEVRFRDWLFTADGRRAARRVALSAGSVLALASAGALLAGLEPIRTIGLPAEQKAALADYRAAVSDWAYDENVCRFGSAEKAGVLDVCRVGDTTGKHTLLIGDSHAQVLAQRYAGLDPAGDYGVTAITRGGCAPLPGVSHTIPGVGCEAFTEAALREAGSGKFDKVIFAAAWSSFLDVRPNGRVPGSVCFHDGRGCQKPRDGAELEAFARLALHRFGEELQSLRSAGVQTVVVLTVPFATANEPSERYREVFNGATPAGDFAQAEFRARTAFSRTELIKVASAHAVIVDPVDHLCRGGVCPAYREGAFLFRDTDHYRGKAVASPLFSFLDPHFLGGVGEPRAGS